MPLLNKKPFVRKKIPKGIRPDDKVFYCELSDEVFTDYDEFWERLVLLNALVWSCEFTGKPNMTFREALDCEAKARTFINIPQKLRIPVYYMTSLTKRTKINDVCDDVFGFIRNRYFVGEKVDAIVGKHWYDCKVTKVILPTDEEVAKFKREQAESDEEERNSKELNSIETQNGYNSDSDIVIIRDDHKKTPSKEPSNGVEIITLHDSEEDWDGYPPYATIKYEVEELEALDFKECKRHVVKWEQIRRVKTAFTKEKCKLFLKQCTLLGNKGLYVLKDHIQKKYLEGLNFSDIFVGRPPKYEESKPRKLFLPSSEQQKKSNEEKKVVNGKKLNKKLENGISKTPEKSTKSPSALPKEDPTVKQALKEKKIEEREKLKEQKIEEKKKMKVEMKLRLDAMRAKQKKEKEIQREEKWLMDLCMMEWLKVKEDLKIGNHKDFPTATKVQCRIPQEDFGDFLVVLEFMNAFADLVELSDVYPQGITFDMLEHAIVEKEVAGIFNDIVQLLVGAIFSLQEEEEEEIQADNTVDTGEIDLEVHLESKDLKVAVSIANKASTWCQQSHGVSLQKAPLDALTLTEVVRLHLLSSGATNVTNAGWRMLNRGGYKSTDDPCLQFKIEHPKILKKLSTCSIFDLTVDEKLKILIVLISQIITYASVRDSIDDKIEKLRELKNNLRLHKFAENKKERQEKLIERQKVREKQEKQKNKTVADANKNGNLAGESDGNKDAKQNGEAMEVEKVDENDNEQNEEDRIKEERLKEKRRQESLKKEKSLQDQIANLSLAVCQLPLGYDRAHRRYWLVHSVPALFIECCYDLIGSCQKTPTPSFEQPPNENKNLKELLRSEALKVLTMKEKDLQSNKENVKDHKPEETKDLKEEEDDEDMDWINIPGLMESAGNCQDTKKKDSSVFGVCTANMETCSVHSTKCQRDKWLFYHGETVLQDFLNSLNGRGLRESELKENISAHRDAVEEALKNCPAYKFDPTLEPDTMTTVLPRKSRGNNIPTPQSANLNFAPNTPISEILELTLRDMILEVEEKLDTGLLGRLKIQDRLAWRTAIIEHNPISTSNNSDCDWGGRKRLNELKVTYGFEIKEEDDPNELLTEDKSTSTDAVKDLSLAILMIGQAVDAKYLKAPLVDTEKFQRQRQKVENRLRRMAKKDIADDSSSSDEEENVEDKIRKQITVSDNSLRTPFERWEKSLMSSTSFSQLFLHLATIDNSICWSRSALNARCCICRRKSDPENMLLCDECDKGYHIYCLKPKLKVIPSGDWYCDKCKPKEKSKTPVKKRKIYCELSDEEEEMVENEESSEASEESEIVNMEYCAACEMGGELVCCDTCPRSFHTDCADLRKVPRGSWSCPLCKEGEKKKAVKRRYHEIEEDTSKNEIDTLHSLLSDLTNQKDSWPFVKPVFKVDCPDYYKKIKKPMDFGTMKKRLNKNKYTSESEFIADVLLIFQNCQQYYKETSAEYKAANKLSKYFWAKCDKLGLQSKEHSVKAPPKKKARL